MRVDHAQGEVSRDERVMGLHVRTTSRVGGTEAETMGGKVITGPMHIVMGFNTRRLSYDGGM